MSSINPETIVQKKKRNGLLAISPMILLIITFLTTGISFGDFYKVPLLLIFILTSAYAIITTPNYTINERINHFSRGAGNKNLLYMVWIFILAGAFANSAKTMGAIDATVSITLSLLPESLLLPGIFVTACFVSLSIGTSVGTIVALTPIASGFSAETGLNLPLIASATVGGALFGDNLSFISDTTIAATRTLGCKMKDKFKVNFKIVLPAAIITTIVYAILGSDVAPYANPNPITPTTVLCMLPYLAVLISAIAGLNVITTLCVGILLNGIIGMAVVNCSLFDWFASITQGINGMGELILISMIAGGLLELIRINGGITYIIHRLTRRVKNTKGAECSIALLVSITNCCTANNTIAILSVGKIANDISERFNIDKRRSASLLDICSCIVQGFIPYGAQLLIAAGIASISPLQIIPYLYYPMLLAITVVLSIAFSYPKLHAQKYRQ